MVICLLFFMAFFSPLAAQDVKVIAQIDQEKIYEKQPVNGTITITHDGNLKVDQSSFRLDKAALKTDFVQEVKISPTDPLVITIYKFSLDPQPKGLYVLPEVSVKVGSKIYRSPPSTYEVQSGETEAAPPAGSAAAKPSPADQSPSVPPEEATLKLEAFVDGKTELLPGEHTRFVYRYLFSGDIALTSEKLPLLDAEGMVKIGEKEIKDSTQGNLNIRDIIQEVKAIKPGDYSFGPSVIEGYAYQVDRFGNQVFSKNKLQSEAPLVKITVKPFPGEQKPASFNGAVGDFTFSVSLKSPPKVHVGDEITILVKIEGDGNLANVPLPEICCQPGLSGLFKMSDLPPAGEINGKSKQFAVQLRPLSVKINEIPPIEFSFYNPNSSTYVTLQSEPIPIHVVDIPKEPEEPPLQEPAQEILLPATPQALEIEKNFTLNSSDLHNKWFGTWWAVAIVPLGIAFLIYQASLQEYLRRRAQTVKVKSSAELLQDALALNEKDPRFYDQLSKALRQIWQERPQMKSEELEEIQQLLKDIEENRFSGLAHYSPSQLKKRAETIIHKVNTP